MPSAVNNVLHNIVDAYNKEDGLLAGFDETSGAPQWTG